MKKLLSVIAILLIAVMLVTALAACGEGEDTENNDKDNKQDTVKDKNEATDSSPESDEKLLKDKGYTVSNFTSSALIGTYASSIGADRGDVISVTTATNNEKEATVYIYYFKDAATAKACYDANWADYSTYHLLGSRIIFDNGADKVFDYGGSQSGTNTSDEPVDNGLKYSFNETEKTASVDQYDYDDAEVVIPSSVYGYTVVNIGGSVFYGKSLKKVTIPDTVKTIEGGAFKNCVNLTDVRIPDSVTSIGGYCFEGCTALESIVLPASVTSIGPRCFQECTALKGVLFSAQVDCISDGLFSTCSSLTTITLPETVTEIERYAFVKCSSMKTIKIPEGVTIIGENAFDRTALGEIYFDGTADQWRAIELGRQWNYDCKSITIHCSNDDLTITRD